ncbi:NACHT, LRR and PYD domains-containing protein 3-like [Oreochromis niloticus]|uniref:NACHT, LRR and PYD domains-containing protein 3-like n=1 Tax=Oreochromis niloticus TaxID=8128 RepID=A0A669ETX6_ORENI|nr:NACHT, LRR and PYD domains-containing protein 3-like [Oreochromis niloticus]
MVTEVRGFTDPQKKEYFMKRFKDEEQANSIFSQVMTSKSLHIMCHIPIFCWITATVMESVSKTRQDGRLPKTLTEMYIHFLVIQTKVKNIKYDGRAETDPHWSPESRKMVEELGKLAFEQLQKDNLVFYESDLTECGINVREASDYSGVFTQIFKEERGVYQEKMFCFIHLTIQEFLAALHVHLTFTKSGINLMEEQQTASKQTEESAAIHFYQSVIDKALQSPNGHLDLFLRFILGLSLQTNQILLQGLLTPTGSSLQISQEIVLYIKNKVNENFPVEKKIQLFHCLNELNDDSIVKEIQRHLSSGRLSRYNLSPAQWSALVFILHSSQKSWDVIDLKTYSASAEALLRLLPVVKICKKALLSGCNLTQRSCEALSSVLSATSSRLIELDMSNNNLQDSGVELLCAGLASPQCTLQTLRLSGCQITERGCASRASALRSNPSHLRELDLSYNHPGDSGIKLLSPLWDDPCWRLDTLRMDPHGDQWMKTGLKKYFCELTVDQNTVHSNLKLSDNNRKVVHMNEDQLYPDHPDRFDSPQLMCTNSLTGRSYWEVEHSGEVLIAVTYKGIKRKGNSDDNRFGRTDESWSLYCDNTDYFAVHNYTSTAIRVPCSSAPHKVAVYVDCDVGTVSFYKVFPEMLYHLHTFNTTFTEPIYPGFRVRLRDSHIYICPDSEN